MNHPKDKINNNNITKCNRCNISLIYEEISNHECFRFKDFWIVEGKIWVGNGKRYYRYFSPMVFQQRNKTTDDETEPKNLIIN